MPKSREVHLVLDNYATHKTPEVTAWLSKHPRFHLHFTPTSASWLNMVERFFVEITSRRIRRGSYASVDDLEAAIYDASIIAVFSSGSSAASPARIRANTPFSLQRFHRL